MTDIDLSDETLESWLSASAAEYEVPAAALDDILAAAGESAKPRAARFQHPRLAAAAVLVIAAVGGAALWGSVGHGGSTAPTAGSATASRDVARTAVNGASGGITGAPAFTNGGSGGTAAAAGAAPPDAAAVPQKAVHGAVTGSPSPSADFGSPATSGGDGAKIVHTGTLGLTVPKGQVSPVLTKLTGLATGFGGYVSSSTTAESNRRPTGTVVLRVPAASFDAMLAQARTYGTVTSTSSSAQDVTGQFTDLNARLTALKKSRDHYLTLLAGAKTVPETLSVQQRIDDAQTQIDQLQGQLNVLANQASYGTLSVTVTQKAAVVVPPKPAPVHRQSGLSKAWHSAKDGFVTGVEALIARSGRALVVLLVLLAGLAVARAAWRIGRRRLV